MEVLAHEFVHLPIIISDYDAILLEPSSPSSPSSPLSSTAHSTTGRTSPTPNVNINTTTSSTPSSSATCSPIHQNSSSGFTEFADDLWSRMTYGMKQKLRAACVEVLRRTDDNDAREEEEKGGWAYDEDARFLD
ncbi:hypothetical protein LTR36_002591 [Oleoguttula mirabilis]|uniref:Uncharacterized protein n=1 Tax=Oleoguttula mirabilis TaxID=1507867 RepID=A0AAV9JJM6_9PEZI|nr:hypothetical protein LTR36_002591 [Oleoguttula mirabilis]